VGAKRAGDFQRADRLRNELRALGVAVLDREREWHVIAGDGLGRPDGGGEGPYGGYGGAHNMSERFGETGHDYTRGDDGTIECDAAKVRAPILAGGCRVRLGLGGRFAGALPALLSSCAFRCLPCLSPPALPVLPALHTLPPCALSVGRECRRLEAGQRGGGWGMHSR
jgi:hypothetical protein